MFLLHRHRLNGLYVLFIYRDLQSFEASHSSFSKSELNIFSIITHPFIQATSLLNFVESSSSTDVQNLVSIGIVLLKFLIFLKQISYLFFTKVRELLALYALYLFTLLQNTSFVDPHTLSCRFHYLHYKKCHFQSTNTVELVL